MGRILLVEDSEESKDLAFQALGDTGEIVWAATLAEAKHFLKQETFELLLLDVGLPDGDGFHFFSLLQNDEKHKSLPVIFLTAKDSTSDKVLGISLGAEDYVIKPFVAIELKARVDMRLKKQATKKETGQVLKKGNLEINLTEQRAFILSTQALGQVKKDLELTQLEFKLLVLLFRHEEQVFTRDQLLSQVWGENTHLTDRCVDTHVYSLRKKLEMHSFYIQSVYGQGYRFSTQPQGPTTEKNAA